MVYCPYPRRVKNQTIYRCIFQRQNFLCSYVRTLSASPAEVKLTTTPMVVICSFNRAMRCDSVLFINFIIQRFYLEKSTQICPEMHVHVVRCTTMWQKHPQYLIFEKLHIVKVLRISFNTKGDYLGLFLNGCYN